MTYQSVTIQLECCCFIFQIGSSHQMTNLVGVACGSLCGLGIEPIFQTKPASHVDTIWYQLTTFPSHCSFRSIRKLWNGCQLYVLKVFFQILQIDFQWFKEKGHHLCVKNKHSKNLRGLHPIVQLRNSGPRSAYLRRINILITPSSVHGAHPPTYPAPKQTVGKQIHRQPMHFVMILNWLLCSQPTM